MTQPEHESREAQATDAPSGLRRGMDRLRQVALHLLGLGTALLALTLWNLYTYTHPPEGPFDPTGPLLSAAIVLAISVALSLGNCYLQRLTTYAWLSAGFALGVVSLSGHPDFYSIRPLTLLFLGGSGVLLAASGVQAWAAKETDD